MGGIIQNLHVFGEGGTKSDILSLYGLENPYKQITNHPKVLHPGDKVI